MARKTSGNSCGRTGSPIGCSNHSMISSITAAMPGTLSSISPGRSCPSRAAIGQTWVIQCEDWYKRALLEPESSPLHIGAEILALRQGIVTGLILAPAILFRLAEAGDIALNAVGEDAIAPLVVGAHLLVRRIGVAVAMHR